MSQRKYDFQKEENDMVGKKVDNNNKNIRKYDAVRTSSMKNEPNLTRISRIVVAIDLSEYSKRVMEKACILATVFKSDVYLVSVVKMAKLVAEEGDINLQELKEEEEQFSRHHRMLIDKYYTGFNLLVESKILHGDPASKICEFATSVSADIIIIGNTGKSGLKRVFLGSTSEAVSHRAPCSVLIVKKLRSK
jgi:nucleotide-binding universal stress UspA family protein